MSQSTTPTPPPAPRPLAPEYAPLAWTAVASLGIAAIFVIALIAMGISAYRAGQPLLVPLLLVLPFIAVVLAFVARRQIRVSEGTTTGEVYANAGWWIAILAGLGYFAYLGAIEFSIRQETRLEFEQWTSHLEAMDPDNPNDAEFYAAFYYMMPAPLQESAGNPRNTDMIRDLSAEQDIAFRNSNLVQVCLRNHGALDFESRGLKNWEKLPDQIQCTVSGSVTSPEGEHMIEIVMVQVIDDSFKDARWEFRKGGQDYITARWLTPYGWHIDYLLRSAQAFGMGYVNSLTQPDQGTLAYLSYLEPGGNPQRAAEQMTELMNANLGLGTLAGGTATTLAGLPRSEAWAEFRAGKLFRNVEGEPMEPARIEALLDALDTPGMVQPAGSVIKTNPNTNPMVQYNDEKITVRLPIEIVDPSSTTGPAPFAAVGSLMIEATQADNPEHFKTLLEQKANWESASRTVTPPIQYNDMPVRWRIVGFESDMVMTETMQEREMGQ